MYSRVRLPVLWLALFFVLSLTASALENPYFSDSLEMELTIEGSFELTAEGSNPQLQRAEAELLLLPQTDFRQTTLSLKQPGTLLPDKVLYRWDDQQLGRKKFGYTAMIRTNNQRMKVKGKIPYPLSPEQVREEEDYLKPTKTIDSDNPAIIAKATELAEGEDDLFKVAFKVANWVDENVKYDLTTLTAETSQKASWVLENKQGVCDEMTSLFVAMMRSLGVPARFVSGVSYTTSDLFSYPWQPHGWAEVYFPGLGWVSFDLTFGQYGYVDVTHIKLRDGFDPQEPATRYEWVANKVGLEADELKITVRITKQGEAQPEEVQLEQDILAPEVGLGSYNLIKGIVKNTADFYAATTLKLAVPSELQIVGKNKRTVLLAPKEVKETVWVVKVPATLESDFIYTFPSVIYSEKNVSIHDEFTVQNGKPYYSEEEINQLTVQDEEKTYSRKVSFSCDYPPEIKLGSEQKITCRIRNTGNTNLPHLQFCLEGVCEFLDLPINQEKSAAITVKAGHVGWQKVVLSAENQLVEKKAVLEYVVVDDPALTVTVEHPPQVQWGENVPVTLQLAKTSFSEPLDLVIVVDGLAVQQKIESERLDSPQTFLLNLPGQRLARENTLTITTMWKDKEGRLFSDQQTIMVQGTAATFAGKVRLFFNSFLQVFY